MTPEIRYARTSDGVNIAYALRGEGLPLVRIAGWISHLELFQLAFPPYPGVRQLDFDKRGTGLSDRATGDYAVETRLRDVEAVVEAVGLKRFALFGWSEGGPVAIRYAAEHPERVTHLVLNGTWASGMPPKRDTYDAIRALIAAEWGLGSAMLNNLFMPGASAEETERFRLVQERGATAQDALALWDAIPGIDVSGYLDRIACPTLVVHVRGDRVVPFDLGRRLAGAIQGARLVTIEGIRHVPGPAEFRAERRAVAEFLGLAMPEDERTMATVPETGSVRTILFTDVEGHTAMMSRLGDSRGREVLREHERLTREALRSHGGSEVKSMGDGFMASFASPQRALDCAGAIQRAFREAVRGEHLKVRIGVNAGEPVAEDDDLFGASVIAAARIASQAEGGQVLVSNVVRELVAGKGFVFHDTGQHDLKGFEEPVRLWELRCD